MTQKLNLVKGQTVYIKCKVAETEVAGDYPIRLTHEGGHTNADLLLYSDGRYYQHDSNKCIFSENEVMNQIIHRKIEINASH